MALCAHQIGLKDPERVLQELVIDSLAPIALGLLSSGRVIDLGTGVGIPSIPLLVVKPDLHAVLIDERPARLDCARVWGEAAGVSDRMEIVKGKIEGKLPHISGENDILLAKALGPFDKIISMIRPTKNSFRGLLHYTSGADSDGLAYGIGNKIRKIRYVSHETLVEVCRSLK